MELRKMRQLLSAGKSVYDLPLRVAYYARVSTEKDEQLHSLGNQVRYFEELIEKTPAWQLAGGYVDAAVIIGLKTLRLKKCQKHAAF